MNWAILFGMFAMLAGAPPQEVEEEIEELEDSEVEVAPAESKTDASLPKLRWTNAEVISGELQEATATELSWKSPLFEEPLRLRWDAVRRIEQTVPAAAAPESFGISLRDGSHLIGDLVGMNADTVTIKSARHGEVALKRSEVLRLLRLRGGKIIAAGPSGEVGWKLGGGKSDESQPQIPGLDNQGRQPAAVAQLVTGPGGALVFPYWNTYATFALKSPERVEFEVDLRFNAAPAFALYFDGEPAKRIRIETWDDELVVAHGDEFQFIRKIGEKERAISLHVCWDRKTKIGAAFSETGEHLAQWKFTGDIGVSTALTLHGRGRDLTLTRFRVREWDGKPPIARADATTPGVHLTDGRVLGGTVGEISADRLKIAGDASGHALADVEEILLSTDAPAPVADAPALVFADSTLCFGRVVSVTAGRAAVETRFTATPLSVALAGLRQLRLPEQKDKAEAPPDEIQLDADKLHGTLTTNDDGRLRWLPFGGVKPAIPKPASTFKITRKLPPEPAIPATPALFYTSFGDILPAQFRGLNGALVEIESEFVDAKTLPVSVLDAVQFGDFAQTKVTGFDAPGWRIVKGDEKTVVVAGNSVELQPGSAFGHPSALQSDSLQFSFDPVESAGFRVRLFTSGAAGERSTNLLMGTNNKNMYVSVEETDGQGRNFNSALIEPGKPVTVRIEIKDPMILIYIGERVVQQTELDSRRRAGSGIVFEPSEAIFQTESSVKFTGFTTAPVPGRIWLPAIQADMKAQALTIPRFRKERPPHHALVATNGDVLRGEIEATTATHFSFLSGLEKLRIPRARVNAAIWLKPPGKDTATAETSATADALDRVFTRNVRYSGSTLSTLLSVITREIPGITFSNHAGEADKRKVSMQFSRQTVRAALEQICGLFDVRYRVEGNGSITIESGPEPAKKFIEKSYWLKGDAFPEAGAAQVRLAAKGIEFPEGASARWEAGAWQLIVKHTPAAHAKIATLLKKEHGANYSVLTHWLVLANGGRLGLSVEKFGKDFILGTHPEYGRCRIPTALVLSIQTQKPPATSAMQALANWQLRPAREPVIPESGGESSPTIGKEAATFKIPLLAGGDFDLQAERGKVVVLDFWATWCAPCIKSIPGLIEATGAFAEDRVKLIGVNQGEPAEAVKRFLETRGWKFTVAMDATQKIGQQYGVTGIPHTVIVGPDGKVAWVKTGFSPDGPAEAAEAIKKLLEPPAVDAKEEKLP